MSLGQKGETLLHAAIRCGHAPVAEALIQRFFVDVRVKDSVRVSTGREASRWLSYEWDDKVVKQLC